MAERHFKERIGIVLSQKMAKTVVVEVTRTAQHPTYLKVHKEKRKYPAHDEKQIAKVGDKVRIKETKPISKTKRWRVAEVIPSGK